MPMTKDSELATPEAVDARVVEVKAERNAARLTESGYAGRRLTFWAAKWRGKVAGLTRRLNALAARRAELVKARVLGPCAGCPRDESWAATASMRRPPPSPSRLRSRRTTSRNPLVGPSGRGTDMANSSSFGVVKTAPAPNQARADTLLEARAQGSPRPRPEGARRPLHRGRP